MCTDLDLTGTIQSGIVRGVISVGIEDRDRQYCVFNPLHKVGGRKDKGGGGGGGGGGSKEDRGAHFEYLLPSRNTPIRG